MEREHAVDTSLKSDLIACLASQDVVPLLSKTVEYDSRNCDNGHHGFVLRHEYESGPEVRVHIGVCFDADTLRDALKGALKTYSYASLDALLVEWRVD